MHANSVFVSLVVDGICMQSQYLYIDVLINIGSACWQSVLACECVRVSRMRERAAASLRFLSPPFSTLMDLGGAGGRVSFMSYLLLCSCNVHRE